MAAVGIVKALLGALVTLALSGCATSYYSWGDYEESVYRVSQEGFEIGEEIKLLEDHLEQVILRHQRIPPGYHAHLAYLHALAGDPGAASRHLVAEKELFPESAVFIDGTLSRMSGGRP